MARSACWCGVSAGGDEAAGGEAIESSSSSSEPGGEGGAEGGALAPTRVAMGLSSSLLVLRGSENSSLLEEPGAGAGAREDSAGGEADVDPSAPPSDRASDVAGARARDGSSGLPSDMASSAAGAGVGGDVG
eukprot:4575185-Pleurochrysis_carterae.AAC.1